ncbi:hypothetical protein EA004_29600, partial [Vibrio anguillarum]|nr:hypothetical protein [Vibrio anguillarum]
VVVYDRDACVQMSYLLGKQLGFDAVEVVMNVDQAPIKDEDERKKGKVNKDWRKWKQELELPIKESDFERWQE